MSGTTPRAANSGSDTTAIAFAANHSRMPRAPLSRSEDSTSSMTADRAIVTNSRLTTINMGSGRGANTEVDCCMVSNINEKPYLHVGFCFLG
jgi:hypothetical protein